MMRTLNPPTTLFALWLFIILNIVFRDIHQMVKKSHLEMLLTGSYNGQPVTDELMLFGGFVVETLLLMMLLSLLLKRKYNRPLNFIGLVLSAGIFLIEPPSDMDDVFFKIVQGITLLIIFYINLKWKAPDQIGQDAALPTLQDDTFFT